METGNPVTGCTKISAGCDNCYAERFSERFRGVPGHPFENGFDLQLRPQRLDQPLRWARSEDDFRQLDERSLSQGSPVQIH
jgi:protein gp37